MKLEAVKLEAVNVARPQAARRAKAGACVIAAALATGCAAIAPPPLAGTVEALVGRPQTEAIARLGEPTARRTGAGGALRLEYASGPFGRTTWMLDVNAAGRIVATTQVLEEARLHAAQPALGGLPAAEVLWRLGSPGERRGGGRAGGEVWSWRYPTNDCLWFQVTIDDTATARGGAFGIDPRCDPPSDGWK